MWFESLTGFREESPAQVRSKIIVDGETMTSTVNGREMICGSLESPTLGELRSRVQSGNPPQRALKLTEVVEDVQELHRQPAWCGMHAAREYAEACVQSGADRGAGVGVRSVFGSS